MMKEEIRFLISPELKVKFKIACLKNNIKPPLQLGELIRKFVETCDENEKLTKHLRK